MDYKQKYEQALERAKIINPGTADYEVAVKIFPEIEENEDEKMRKQLLNWFKDCSWDIIDDGNLKREDIIAWLEKQGELNTFSIPQTPIKNATEVKSRINYISDDMKPIAEFIMGYANWNLHKDEWNQPTLTVPLFRVLDALIQRGKPYCECIQNTEKKDEQKPAEWSEEDENAIQVLKDIVKHSNEINENIYTTSLKEKLYDWLKSLKKKNKRKIKRKCLIF